MKYRCSLFDYEPIDNSNSEDESCEKIKLGPSSYSHAFWESIGNKLFATKEESDQWFVTPHPDLNEKTPFEAMDYGPEGEPLTRLVEKMLEEKHMASN